MVRRVLEPSSRLLEGLDGLQDDFVPDDDFGLNVWRDGYIGPGLDLSGIDWLIVGGESGPGHRPMDLQWARDLRDACDATRIGDERPDTAFFMKQTGGTRPGTKLEDLPQDLRIRQMPRTTP